MLFLFVIWTQKKSNKKGYATLENYFKFVWGYHCLCGVCMQTYNNEWICANMVLTSIWREESKRISVGGELFSSAPIVIYFRNRICVTVNCQSIATICFLIVINYVISMYKYQMKPKKKMHTKPLKYSMKFLVPDENHVNLYEYWTVNRATTAMPMAMKIQYDFCVFVCVLEYFKIGKFCLRDWVVWSQWFLV